MPKLTIDGREIEVADGLTVLQACELAGTPLFPSTIATAAEKKSFNISTTRCGEIFSAIEVNPSISA